MNVAQQYINTASDGRSPDTPVLQVAAGNEPPLFTQHFRGWDPLLTDKNTFVDPYQAKLAAAREEEVCRVVVVALVLGKLVAIEHSVFVTSEVSFTPYTFTPYMSGCLSLFFFFLLCWLAVLVRPAV